MRKVLFSINMSLDGYVDHDAFNPDEKLLDYFTNQMSGVDLLFFGRNMYELMFPYWELVAKEQSGSQAENRFAERFTKIKRAVVSKNFEPKDESVLVIRENPVQALLQLKQQPGGNIFVDSISMLPALLSRGLIDGCNLIYHPAFVGKGRQLLPAGSLQENYGFTLKQTKVFDSGCIALEYEKVI